MRIASGLGPLVGPYDGVISDLWGVVHDGRTPYPGAAACLARLRAEGRRVVLLSNAPRPSADVALRLGEMGIDARHYDAVVTSGEVTIEALNGGTDAAHRALGPRYHHLGPERDLGLVRAIDRAAVPLAEADFIVATGLLHDERETAEDYRAMFAGAIGRGLPLVCANPDVVVVRGTELVPCAGALAALYETMGGRVIRHGKPEPGAFRAALARLPGVAPQRVVMLGDGPDTDLKGAEAAGLDAIWVVGGIHAADVGCRPGEPLDEGRVAGFMAARGRRPVAAVPALVW